MRRESRKRRSAVSGRQRERQRERERKRETQRERRRGCAYDVGHVGETQRDIRRAHSWAPRRDVKSYLSLSLRFIRRSVVLRCTMHAMRHDAHARPYTGLISTPSISVQFTLAGWTGVLKKDSRPRPFDRKRSPAIVTSLVLPCGRKCIQFIQFIFKVKRTSQLMIHEAVVITYLR